MKTKCPCCGASLSLDVLVAHEASREAFKQVFALSGSLGSAVVRYLALFRPESRDLSMDRVAKLLGEIIPDIQAQRISRNGQVFDAPVDAWIWAIDQAVAARDAGRLKIPLKGHGWLYEVISTYRASADAVLLPQTTAVKRSKTLSGLAALEELKHG